MLAHLQVDQDLYCTLTGRCTATSNEQCCLLCLTLYSDTDLETQRIMEAAMTESQLDEVETLLTSIICIFNKYSQSEALLTRAEEPELALKLPCDSVQPFSPVTEADVWRSNGFCLANTETILYDTFLLKSKSEKLKCADMESYMVQENV